MLGYDVEFKKKENFGVKYGKSVKLICGKKRRWRGILETVK